MSFASIAETLEISSEILSLVAEIDEFKGTWRASSTLTPERLGSLRRVASIASVGSSTRIEGSRLTDSQVAALLANLGMQTFEGRDEQEVAGYAEVMDTVLEVWSDLPLTENYILQSHRDLLRHSVKDERHRGRYKTFPNHVAAFDPSGKEIAVVFETASPFDTPRLMAELVAWWTEANTVRVLHPLLVAGVFTIQFLAIHPFQDGNGRLSRILTTLLLLKAGYAYVPYSSLESVIESTKEGYYRALRQTQGTLRAPVPDWQPWLVYFLRALRQQKRLLELRLEEEALAAASMPELAARLVEQARQHGRITMGGMLRLTGANRNTLKDHLRRLVAQRRLAHHGRGKGSWYALP